jgi:hypothetical protein
MILQILQDYLFVVLIKILLLFSNLYLMVISMLHVYLLILYVLHHAIPIQVHSRLEHKVHKLMVVLFQLKNLVVVGMKLVIVVEFVFE